MRALNLIVQSFLCRNLVLFLFVLLVYGPVLSHPFMLEDDSIFGFWFRPLNWDSFLACFDPQARSVIYFRPVISVSNLLLFNITGGEVILYRVMSLILFAGFLSMLYILTRQLFREHWMALMTAVLFCVHPINAFYVNHLSASANLIWGMLFLGVLISHLAYVENQKKIWDLGSYVLTVLALAAHEMTVILPGFIFLIDLWIGKSWRQSFKKALIFGGITAVFQMGRSLIVPSSGGILPMIQTGSTVLGLNIQNYLSTTVVLVGWYLKQLVWPTQILFMKTILPVKNDIGIIGVFAGMVIAGLAIFLTAVKDFRLKFLAVWFLIGIVPFFMASLIYPFEGVTIEPHWLMIGSLSFFWAAALCFQKMHEKLNQGIVLGLIGVVIISAVVFTQKYNDLWRSQRSYCLYWLSLQPGQQIAHFWLATDYLKTKEYRLAKEHFKHALNGSFVDWEVFSNLGLIALLEDHLREAVLWCQNALRINPNAAEALAYLGVVAWRQGQAAEAADLFKRSIAADPSLALAGDSLKFILQQHPSKQRQQ